MESCNCHDESSTERLEMVLLFLWSVQKTSVSNSDLQFENNLKSIVSIPKFKDSKSPYRGLPVSLTTLYKDSEANVECQMGCQWLQSRKSHTASVQGAHVVMAILCTHSLDTFHEHILCVQSLELLSSIEKLTVKVSNRETTV